MIFNHNRSSKGLGFGFGFAGKGKKKVSAINAHAYCVHARLDANQECVCTRVYTCLCTHSILVPQVKEKAPWLIHVANDNSADDATTRVRRNDASRDAVVAPAVGHLINAAIFN